MSGVADYFCHRCGQARRLRLAFGGGAVADIAAGFRLGVVEYL